MLYENLTKPPLSRFIEPFYMPVILQFLFPFLSAEAQEIKLIQGKIVTDSISAENINIINKNLERGTMSDRNGNFTIATALHDTILFSSVQFLNTELVVDESMFSLGKAEIKLVPAFNELEEVRISDVKLSGMLEKDIDRIKIFDRQKFGIPYSTEPLSQTERHLVTATTGAGGSKLTLPGVLLGKIPLDPIINTINGRIKHLKRIKANDDLATAVGGFINIFGKDFFTESLKIPEKEVTNFLYFCVRQHSYKGMVNSGNSLDLINFFAAQKDEFLKIRKGNE